jgi:hypothetical protein
LSMRSNTPVCFRIFICSFIHFQKWTYLAMRIFFKSNKIRLNQSRPSFHNPIK